MKLTRFDCQFIKVLIRSPEHQKIIVQKLEQTQLLSSSLNPLVSLVKNLTRYLSLWLELIIAALRPGNHKPDSSIFFYDENLDVHPARSEYLQYHLPGKTFIGISYKDRLASIRSPSNLLNGLLKLGAIVLLSSIQSSELSSHYVRIFRTCLLVSSRVRQQTAAEIYLFRTYQIETTFLAAFLKEMGVFVHLIASTTPLAPYNKYLIGDSLKLCNPYQQDEFAHFQKNCDCREAVLWSPEEIVSLANYYCGRPKPSLPDRLGLYTQGFWLRIQMGIFDERVGTQLAEQESELFQIVLLLLQEQPALELVIYPHPLERRHRQKADDYFARLVSDHDRVRIDFANSNSSLTFDQVGLGLTTVSTIGFDRIYMGFRTLFYIPRPVFLDTAIPSTYNALFCTSQEELITKIEQVRWMSHSEFMNHFFCKEFWQLDRSPEGGSIAG